MYNSVEETFKRVNNTLVSKNSLHSALINQWLIPSHLKENLEYYAIQEWHGMHVQNKNNQGKINRDGVGYLVVFHKCTPHKVYNAEKVRLSFRAAKSEWNLPAYVLVQPVVEKT